MLEILVAATTGDADFCLERDIGSRGRRKRYGLVEDVEGKSCDESGVECRRGLDCRDLVRSRRR